MTEVVFAFDTQEQADNTVLALSKGYNVVQWCSAVNTTAKPYCVKVYVPNYNVVQISEE